MNSQDISDMNCRGSMWRGFKEKVEAKIMRPYRGKRKDNGEWVKGFLISPNRIMVWDKDVCMRSESYEVIPETVGQQTGRKDKNSKPIYEGDRVRWVVRDEKGEGVVIWDDKKAQFNVAEFYAAYQDCPGCIFSKNHIVEIIGNIHDNPELLK